METSNNKFYADRLDRIEDKIDKLADTVVAIARAEEKLVALEVARDSQAKIDAVHEKRLDMLEKRQTQAESNMSVIRKVFWGIFAPAIIAILASQFLEHVS